jgi:hypothetical protein
MRGIPAESVPAAQLAAMLEGSPRARHYDPATGQFITVDPFSKATHIPYAYANNDPTNQTDPNGLCPKTSSKGICDAIKELVKALSEFGVGDPLINSDIVSCTGYNFVLRNGLVIQGPWWLPLSPGFNVSPGFGIGWANVNALPLGLAPNLHTDVGIALPPEPVQAPSGPSDLSYPWLAGPGVVLP